jgi:hypothetical protein
MPKVDPPILIGTALGTSLNQLTDNWAALFRAQRRLNKTLMKQPFALEDLEPEQWLSHRAGHLFRLDDDGLPSLIQRLKFNHGTLCWEAYLFNGSVKTVTQEFLEDVLSEVDDPLLEDVYKALESLL